MSVKLKEYFDVDNKGNIKPRTTMRCNRWFISIDNRHYGQVRPPTNYYEKRDGLIDGKMLFEIDEDITLPTGIKHSDVEFVALGPIGDLIETTTFKNVILRNTNTENVLLLEFDSFEYKKS